MFLGITSNSQFPDHIYMVSVSEPLCQTISQFQLPPSLSALVSQLSHNALSLATLPPPVPGSARISRPRVLINSDTPAIPRSRKGKRNLGTGAHPGRRRQYLSEEKRNVRFPGKVRPCVTPTNSENIQLTLFTLGSHLLEDVLALRSGASMQERRSKICSPRAKIKKRVIGFLSNIIRCHLHKVDVAAP